MGNLDRRSLEACLTAYDRLLEVGIGERTDLARRLADAGCDVVAIDIAPVCTPPGVTTITADVTEFDVVSLGPFDAVYAQRLPPELHRPTAIAADRVDADLYFTTLGGEFPTVEVTTITTEEGTVYSRERDSRMVL